MKKLSIITAALLSSFFLSNTAGALDEPSQTLSIIPLPMSVEKQVDKLVKVTGAWGISGDAKTTAAFKDLMAKTANVQFSGSSSDGTIKFTLVDKAMGAEGYTLNTTESGIEIQAEDHAGLFYGAVTLWQILMPAMKDGTADIPTLNIKDKPRFGWRGLMLDEARHFQGIDFVKNLIDWMALHKFNIFQWHLVDDQGWRIEIKKYPELTANGAWRVPAGDGAKADLDPATGKPRKIGGFYTQDQIREVVAYAKERHITIVPEIGLPGHAQAAIATYPNMGVNAEKMPVSSDWGIFDFTYNLEQETFTKLENILLEVMDLFPGKYIHLGGDEVQKKQWAADARTKERMKELGIQSVEGIQPYFTRYFDVFLEKNGRKMIGWDEILEGGKINTSATVMSWRGEKGGIEAAHKGHTVVMSPWPVMYLDMHQSISEREPTGRPARSSLGPLKNVYLYEPIPKALEEKGSEYVLGAQGNIWTEHMRTNDHVMHMTFPRAAAISEAIWSPKAKDFEGFVKRLPDQFLRYQKLGIDYADVAFEVLPKIKVNGEKRAVSLSNQVGMGTIRYTVDGSKVTVKSPVYDGEIIVNADQTLRTSTFMNGVQMSAPTIKKMDKVSLSVRTDDTLEVCNPGYHLKLDDDFPRSDKREAFAMNILNPCWIYKDADLTGVTTIEFEVGQVPFNFQIGDDWQKVTFDKPKSKDGELNVYRGKCEGSPIAFIPLKPIVNNHGISTVSAALSMDVDKADLCFKFARPHLVNKGVGQNLWGVNKVTLK